MVGYVFAQKLVFCLTLQAFLIDAPVLVDMKHGSVRYRKDQDAPTLKGREMPHEGSTDLEQKKHYFYHTRLNSFGAGDVYVLVSVSMFGGVYAFYHREKVRRPLNTVHKLSYIKVTDTVTAEIAWGEGGGGETFEFQEYDLIGTDWPCFSCCVSWSKIWNVHKTQKWSGCKRWTLKTLRMPQILYSPSLTTKICLQKW